jgi:hypothetical protein
MAVHAGYKDQCYALFDRGFNRYRASRNLGTSFATVNWHWEKWQALVTAGQRKLPPPHPAIVSADLDAWEVDLVDGLLQGELEALSREGPDGEFDPAADAARIHVLRVKLGL